MKNKGNIIYIIIVLTVLVSIIVGISFAYIIGTQSSDGSLDVNVAIENGVIANFTVTGNTDVTMPISGNAMLEGSAGSVAGTNTTSLTVNLESDITTICSYDIVWEWNNSSDSYVLTSSTNSEPEFTVSGEVQGSNLELEETQVSNYSSSKTLGTFSIAANGSKSTQNWTFTTNFYNINAKQDAHENKTYKGIIKIANADCRKQV